MYKSPYLIALLLFICTSCAPKVDFTADTVPQMDCLKTSVESVRSGNEWDIDVSVRNISDTAVTFKLVLSATPGFRAEKYLIPGINYNGNRFGDNVNLPQGWEREGEPWIFSYDRGSIPSCTTKTMSSPFLLLTRIRLHM